MITVRAIAMGTWMMVLEILIGALGTILAWVKAGKFDTLSIIILVITILIAAAQYILTKVTQGDFVRLGYTIRTIRKVFRTGAIK